MSAIVYGVGTGLKHVWHPLPEHVAQGISACVRCGVERDAQNGDGFCRISGGKPMKAISK